jgi:hypothetical protein
MNKKRLALKEKMKKVTKKPEEFSWEKLVKRIKSKRMMIMTLVNNIKKMKIVMKMYLIKKKSKQVINLELLSLG